MEKMTVRQLDEIRAKAIQAIDESENGKPVAWKDCKIKKVYRGFARAVRRADEEAGFVLVRKEAVGYLKFMLIQAIARGEHEVANKIRDILNTKEL